jgi:hypothetical protein
MTKAAVATMVNLAMAQKAAAFNERLWDWNDDDLAISQRCSDGSPLSPRWDRRRASAREPAAQPKPTAWVGSGVQSGLRGLIDVELCGRGLQQRRFNPLGVAAIDEILQDRVHLDLRAAHEVAIH